MKKMDDEELQKWLEENRTDKYLDGPESDDQKAYRFLFESLDRPPSTSLPFDFSAKVTRKMQAEVRRSSELRYYLTGLVIFTAVLAGLYTLVSLMKPGGVAMAYFTELLQYKWILIMAVASILTIQYLDAVLVKGNVFRR